MKRKYCFVILFLVLAIFLSGCSVGEGTPPPIGSNQSPTASFTADPTSGVVPLEVLFDASNSADSDGNIVSYAWDFKDGTTGSGETVNHTFSSTGSYNVELTVTDNEGATDSATKNITITETNNQPYATVINLTDSKGNTQLLSEYNNKGNTWPYPYPVLTVGETVTITVNVENDVAEPVLYEFIGTGFPNEWQTGNQVTVTIDNEIFNLDTIHLRVFVKNSDEQYRAPYYDDLIQVFYQKEMP